MSIRGKAYIVGAYEHPLRFAPDHSLAQLHAEVAKGALADAGLSKNDVDAYLSAGDAPGMGVISMADYMGLKLSYMDSTETGGSSYVAHVGHAAAAIAAGKCHVALITLAGRPRAEGMQTGTGVRPFFHDAPETGFENVFGITVVGMYAMAARRHMHEYGTTSAQLAAIKVTAAAHAIHNPNAMVRKPLTVDDVLASPLVSDPLHLMDCCVISDGGGALVVVSEDVKKSLKREGAKVLGHGEAPKHLMGGRVDLTHTGAVFSGSRAFAEAKVTPQDIDYASIYDSFTITVLETIEDLGFCPRGQGGPFVADGNLRSPNGKLPWNTDGGGLCNNHPANRGGMTKVIEAVRQLRGEAHPAVQVKDCRLVLAHGTGGSIGTRMGSATVILGKEDA